MGVTYRVIRAWARLLVTTWYRASFRGQPFPEDAPCILVMNHSNGLVDGHFQLAATARPVRVLAKYTLFEIPALGWVVRNVGAIPVYRKKDGVDTSRNADSFRAIYDALAGGDVIAVFPEGESRDTPYLREVKTGAARMALGAEEAADWRARIRVVPIGVTYEEPGRFRSRAEAWVGESFPVSEFADAWQHSPILAGRAMTQRIGATMRALSLQVPPGEDDGRAAAALACAVERLGPPSDEPLAKRRQSAHDRFERLRARDPEGHARRAEGVLDLDRHLRAQRITNHDVFGTETRSPGALIGEVALRALVGVPVGFLCGVVWGPPALLARLIAVRGASTPDKVTTVTMLVTFCGVILWSALLAWLGGRAWPAYFPEVVGALVVGAAALPRAYDNVVVIRHLFGRLRLAGDPAGKARLAEALAKLHGTLERSESL